MRAGEIRNISRYFFKYNYFAVAVTVTTIAPVTAGIEILLPSHALITSPPIVTTTDSTLYASSTDAGIVYGERLDENQYRIKLNLPSVLDLTRKEDCAYVELGDPGVPHAVKQIVGLDWNQKEELFEMAKSLRYDSAFPKGANANLYDWIKEDEIRILTYERGVEDYTLACGTGSASTVVVLWERGQMTGNQMAVHNPGGTLVVSLETENGKIKGIFLEGPTEVVEIKEM